MWQWRHWNNLLWNVTGGGQRREGDEDKRIRRWDGDMFTVNANYRATWSFYFVQLFSHSQCAWNGCRSVTQTGVWGEVGPADRKNGTAGNPERFLEPALNLTSCQAVVWVWNWHYSVIAPISFHSLPPEVCNYQLRTSCYSAPLYDQHWATKHKPSPAVRNWPSCPPHLQVHTAQELLLL